MDVDRVEPAVGGFVEIVLANGWRSLVSVSEITSVKRRREGGAAIFFKSVERPLLVSVAVEHIIDVIEGATYATTT
jgi:hypothetical protein